MKKLVSVLAGLVAALFGLTLAPAHATTTTELAPVTAASTTSTTSTTSIGTIAESALPQEARDTLVLIDQGGPFPYPDNDGVVFQNREGILPAKPLGYYHEYTVPTPGISTRGARRIVTGSGGEYYWTADHYATFARILR